MVHTSPTGFTRGARAEARLCAPSSTSTSSFRKCDGDLGNAAFVTGAMGLLMSSVVVTSLASGTPAPPLAPPAAPPPPPPAPASETETERGFRGFVGDDPSLGRGLGLVDSHCHLQLDPLYAGADEVAGRAEGAGLQMLVSCGVCPGRDWMRLAELTSRLPLLRPQFGLHPWHIRPFLEEHGDEGALERALEEQLREWPGAGVGETGLDRAIRRDLSLEVQTRLLASHLRVAQRLRRPVTLHCVGAWGALLDELRLYPRIPAIVLHAADAMPLEMAERFTAALPQTYFSFNFKGRGEAGAELVRRVPRDRLLLESDSPGRPPEALRGRGVLVHEPAGVLFACVQAARALGLDLSQVAEITRVNAESVFNFNHSN